MYPPQAYSNEVNIGEFRGDIVDILGMDVGKCWNWRLAVASEIESDELNVVGNVGSEEAKKGGIGEKVMDENRCMTWIGDSFDELHIERMGGRRRCGWPPLRRISRSRSEIERETRVVESERMERRHVLGEV